MKKKTNVKLMTARIIMFYSLVVVATPYHIHLLCNASMYAFVVVISQKKNWALKKKREKKITNLSSSRVVTISLANRHMTGASARKLATLSLAWLSM